ncbi:ATP-dependent RNA helicase dhx [Acrasis kona]|uniref:RNA helicase n=1 Tax=Acrasis kona TaxID=1008807 RepID=A0AAW2ZQS8_9EUKA
MNNKEKLQHLSLVNKVCGELDNHVGIKDKTLAEFVIYLCEGCNDATEYKNVLSENKADLPETFVNSLFETIQRMKPKQAPVKQDVKTEEDVIEHRTQKYPGLAMADTNKPIPIEVVKSDKIKTIPGSPSTDPHHSKRHREERHHSDDRRRDSRGSNRRRDDHDDDHDDKKRHDSFDRDLYINQVYRAKVSGIKEYGFFAQLTETVEGVRLDSHCRKEGLCHVSEMQEARGAIVNDLVKRNQYVFVKIIGLTDTRIMLSMRDLDQRDGYDAHPRTKYLPNNEPSSSSSHDNTQESKGRKLTGALPKEVVEKYIAIDAQNEPERAHKRMTPYGLWEATQLNKVVGKQAARLMDQSDPDGNDMITNAHYMMHADHVEQDVDVELNDREPKFLEGQTAKAGVNYSPVRILAAPDGSLRRAAEKQSELALERREIREQQRAQAAVASGLGQDDELGDSKNLLQDPMYNVMNQYNSSNNSNSNNTNSRGNEYSALPEWKRQSMSGGLGKPSTGTISIKEQRASLPIYKLREELIRSVRDNQILVVIGETGSGKTTQMTQYLAEAGFASKGVIGCTQPRRVAAISVAKRVAEEFGCSVGQEVGYCIRFEDKTTPDTCIKYMTDGMLLREALLDPQLVKYSIIMLDEAHERNLHTDVLFGLLKKVCQRRSDLKLIVTSATLDAEKFSTYFFNCPIFTIPGRTFLVEIFYTKEPESDYLNAALITVMQIHLTEPSGDILLFLTGQEEIDTACQILFERMKQLGNNVPELRILPIYSALPSEVQSQIFEPAPPGSRKVVVGTNIAETSITIDGIFYVVDPGFVKQNCYNAKTGVDSLMVVPISKAAARQRAGRAGRTGPGKCYRLYTENSFENEMLAGSVPEIQRTNLGNTVLTLKAMGINDLLGFDFMDPPPPQTLISAMEQLYALGALDDEGLLTRLGRKMAEFPLEPQMSKTLIASVDLQCSDEVLTIVSMLSIQTIFYRPREKQAQADQKKAKFFQPEGDHLTLLASFQAWKNSNYSNAWCYDNFIQARSMKRVLEVRKQLLTIMDRYKLDVVSCGKNYTLIRKAICSGYFAHACRKDPQEGYHTLVENQPVYIHPGSSLFQKNPEWVLYHTLVMTTKEYMREIMTIEPKWLCELAPNFYRGVDPNKMSKRKRAEKIEPLFNKYADKDEWRISKRKKMK